ncbi:MAG: cation:proton antiporter, partial [Ktedonobacterales bacterium]
MAGLGEGPLLFTLLALAVIVVLARGAGDIAKRLGQPEVVGEFVVGFGLGPSVLGALLPGIHSALFLSQPVALVLSGFAWIGAILLLFIAGLEVDIAILRAEVRPGALAAALAIVPSVLAGIGFALVVLRRPLAYALFLGIVLSVTAVSVAAKILIEREVLRRRYAQVILAAGIASEVLVWLMVSVVSAAHENSPALAIRSGIFALGFFLVMLTIGRRFVFWAMRRVADSSRATKGQFSLVIALMLFSAVLTQAMGLHPLLGAFVFGVLLSRAPRTNKPFVESIQTVTSGFFAPIFFVLAGMRVDLSQVGGASAIGVIALLLIVATLVKAGLGALGARLGGLERWEAALVGVGLNMKGGTDVIVAIVGVELGLMTVRVYTLYAVVAILTVFLSPVALTYLARHAPPTAGERDRLEREEASRRGYASRIERVLVPAVPQLLPALASQV